MSLVACVADCCVVLHTPLLYKLGRLHLAAAAITPPSSQLSLAERAVEEVAVLMLIVGCCRCGVDNSDGFVGAGGFVETGSITSGFDGDDGGESEAPVASIAHDEGSVGVLASLDGLCGGSGVRRRISHVVCSMFDRWILLSIRWMQAIDVEHTRSWRGRNNRKARDR